MPTHNHPSLVVPPISNNHVQSFVLLHGRGSNGRKFGLELLATHIPGYGLLQDVFPDAKFVFLTAAKRRAQIYNRSWIHQWFDNWHLDTPTQREELQYDGLRESTTAIHGVLEAEIAAVGAPNVILGGLSQGCAAALIALLLWKQAPFAGTIGMCGWLPLRSRMEIVLAGGEVPSDDDPFTSPTDEHGTETSFDKVVAYLKDELNMRLSSAPRLLSTSPIYLGHGVKDDRVPLILAREANQLLSKLDIPIQYEEYPELGHWYSGYMLRGIVQFLRQKGGLRLGPAVPQQAQT